MSHGKVSVSSKKTGEKQKHVSLSSQDKVKITEKLEAGMSGVTIVDQYAILKHTVADIKRNKGKFKQHAVNFDISNSGEISKKKIEETM